MGEVGGGEGGGGIEGGRGGVVDVEPGGRGGKVEGLVVEGFELEVEKVALEAAGGGRGVPARVGEGGEAGRGEKISGGFSSGAKHGGVELVKLDLDG